MLSRGLAVVGRHPGYFCDSVAQLSMLKFTKKQGTETREPVKGSHLWQAEGRRNSERDNKHLVGLPREGQGCQRLATWDQGIYL